MMSQSSARPYSPGASSVVSSDYSVMDDSDRVDAYGSSAGARGDSWSDSASEMDASEVESHAGDAEDDDDGLGGLEGVGEQGMHFDDDDDDDALMEAELAAVMQKE